MTSKHYLCWQKRFGSGWWPGSEENRGGSNAIRPLGEAHERRQIRAVSLMFTSPVGMPECAPGRACRPKSRPKQPMFV